MRLSDFIEDTLYEIALGVQLAQARAKDLMAINPGSLNGELIDERSYVDFDVSIVVTDEAGTKTSGSGKLGGAIKVASVFSASAEAGGERESSQARSKEQTHRVSFKVPVHMNADFKDNPAAAEAASRLLEIHQRSG